MKKFTIIQQFSFLCFLALILFAIVLGSIIASSLERNMLTMAQNTTAKIVSDDFRKLLTDTDLTTPKTSADLDAFAAKVKNLSRGPDIERIKIYNKERVVIWSDQKQLIGQCFPDNKELDDAFLGKTASEISTLEKVENQYERQFGKMLELYVPIQLNSSAGIHAVIDIYQNLDPLFHDIAKQKRIVWLTTIIGFLFLYLFLFQIVWHASRKIDLQTKEIVQSEERYRSLVQSAFDAIISLDRQGKVVLFNKAAERIFGYSGQEMIDQIPIMLIPDRYHARFLVWITRFSRTGHITSVDRTIEIEGVRKNGQVFPIEMSLSVSGSEDRLTVTGTIRDISERKIIQEQLVEAEKQASVSTIAGGIGHEINNTIGSLMGYAGLLTRYPDDIQLVRKSADIFNTQTQRLKLHAHNLLNLNKPREPEMKPLDLKNLIDKVTDLLVTSGLLRMCTIIRDYSDDLPQVWGDEILIEQLLMNLEINAAHAMDNNGILTLKTSLSEDRSFAELSIADSGHGIPDDKRHQIFLPFFTTKENGKGTGLGMFIVRQVIDQHKGYIQLDSQVGVGTTVIIGLPVMKKPMRPDQST